MTIEFLLCGLTLILVGIIFYRGIVSVKRRHTPIEIAQWIEGSEDTKVTVRIWKSAANPHGNQTGQNVGHVSVEFGLNYVSLWPPDEEKSLFPVGHELVRELIQDELLEERRAEATFIFYSLNIDKMNHHLEEFMRILTRPGAGWCLWGPIWNGNTHSCASFAWELLKAGGVSSLLNCISQADISSQESSYGSYRIFQGLAQSNLEECAKSACYSSEMAVSLLIRSPDILLSFLKAAQAREQEILEINQQQKLKEN